MICGGLFVSHIPSVTTLQGNAGKKKKREGEVTCFTKISSAVLGREFMQSQRNNIRKACTEFFSCSAIIYF